MIGGATLAGLSIGTFWFFNNRSIPKEKSKTSKVSFRKGKTINLSTAAGTRQVPNWNNSFHTNYTKDVTQWLQPKSIIEMDKNTALKYAKIIKNSKGTFNDDEEAIRLIFSKRLRDKTNVSSISKAFWNQYNKDMWQYLNSFLSKSELHQYVTKPVKQLPNYTIA